MIIISIHQLYGVDNTTTNQRLVSSNKAPLIECGVSKMRHASVSFYRAFVEDIIEFTWFKLKFNFIDVLRLNKVLSRESILSD